MKGQIPNAISSHRSTMVTCIGACNAISNNILPFLIFKRKRLSEDLTQGSSPGCGFARSDTGWSNSHIFQGICKIISSNLCQEMMIPMFWFYMTLINCGLILFVLPPHSSHLLQPLDSGCSSPLKKSFNTLVHCHCHLKEYPGEIINH